MKSLPITRLIVVDDGDLFQVIEPKTGAILTESVIEQFAIDYAQGFVACMMNYACDNSLFDKWCLEVIGTEDSQEHYYAFMLGVDHASEACESFMERGGQILCSSNNLKQSYRPRLSS